MDEPDCPAILSNGNSQDPRPSAFFLALDVPKAIGRTAATRRQLALPQVAGG